MNDSAPHWRDLYAAAILEVDNSKLVARIEAAQEAIKARLKDNADQEEQLQLCDAHFGLGVLRRERLAPGHTGTNSPQLD